MSTTIDSLEIKIESNSSAAAVGILDLADALGELKKNGTINVAVKNLNNLAEALKKINQVNSNVTKLSTLAKSVKDLSQAGSLNKLINQLNKIPGVINAISNMNTTGIEAKFQSIATAASHMTTVGSFTTTVTQMGKIPAAVQGIVGLNLDGFDAKMTQIANGMKKVSGIDAGGLPKMVDSLAKIADVTSKLDDQTINDFAAKVDKLVQKLQPLAAQMTTVAQGFKAVNTNANKAATGFTRMSGRVNTTTMNITTFVQTIKAVVSALTPLVNLLTSTISQAIEWDGVAARFGRAFGDQAASAYAWVQQLNDEMGINSQQFMQYSSVFASMLQGYGVSLEDSADMAIGYTELVYDIWAGYNDVYKGFADAADAVKSALAGEVEPIRRAGFTIVDSQLAVTAANYGLTYSTQSATEAQKSYLRYLTLVDQAHAQNLVGTYARELNTAEGMMRTFSQQLKSLAQAFGSLFLPVLVKIMPYLQAFVELLTEAIRAVAEFFGITIQSVDWGGYGDQIGSGVGGGLEDIEDGANGATGAIKELKNAMLGIDELNVISPPDPSSGSGSGGGAGDGGGSWDDIDVDSLWDSSILSNLKDQVEAIKEKFKEWLPLIELIGGLITALTLAGFLEDLGKAFTEMGKLKKILASIATVLIEAALVFMFADNYLESGNLLNLIGEALVTAGASYLLFKGWGTKGAVVGMVVSVMAQLAAITLNVADGTVDISDPELWIQTAMTTLTGASAGLFAFKGVAKIGKGKGALLGAAISLSFSLAAMTIGGVAADGFDLRDGITGALSTLLGGVAGAGLFTLLGIATGGVGFLVGGAIMLAINVIGAIIASVKKDTEAELKKDLEERFGKIDLTAEEVELLVERLIPDWSKAVIDAVALQDGVEKLRSGIEDQLREMEYTEWKVSVGLALTEDDFKSYQAAIEDFVDTCQNFITERGYALEVGLKATGASDFVIDTSNMISTAAEQELKNLGQQLQDTVNTAYEDGLLDIDELKAIQTIRNDMLEIVDALNSSKIEAEFDVLEMRWSGVEMTPDSFETLIKDWTDTLQNEVYPALEETVKENLSTLEGNVRFAKIQLEKNPGDAEARQMLEDAERALQEYLDSNPLENMRIEATIEAVTFAINTLRDAFAEEIKRVEDAGYLDYDEALKVTLDFYTELKYDPGTGNGDIYGELEVVTLRLMQEMEQAGQSLSKSARENLEDMIESMSPTMGDLEEVAAANRKIGKAVPENVRNGINDFNEMKALAGDIDGIHYLIGQGFSTDDTFLNTLATVESAGQDLAEGVRQGFLNNATYIYDDATGIIVGIKNAVTGQVTLLTPELEDNLSQMGVNMGDALGGEYQYVYDSTTGLLQSVVDSAGNAVWTNEKIKSKGKEVGENLSSGLKEGLKDDEPSLLEKVGKWCGGVLGKIREVFEINSPSEKTKEMGEYLSEGLGLGFDANSVKDALKDAWNRAKTWWNNSKGKLATYTPDIGNIANKLSGAWKTARTWWNQSKGKLSTYTPEIGNLKGKLYTAWSTAKSWWSKSKGTLSYTPTIGNIKSKLSSAWSTARSWWSKSKGALSYTPTIGSIRDKLKSAWTTAKSWWSKNVKLSIPSMSFKVSYSNSGLGAVKKAIIKALDLPGWPKLSFAANGGIFDAGSLIWAGERGAEVVANAAGGKTGVMNVNQMQDAVYEGVYAAVIAAMRASSRDGGQAVNLYLDGRRITSTVEQRQRERGATIMGNEVYRF